MKVKVRYFALFREQAGCASESVDFPGGTAKELFQMMTTRHPSMSTQAAALVAVNDEMCAWEQLINEKDEVLFFPPVAGG